MEHMKYVHKDPNASGVPGKPGLNSHTSNILITNTSHTILLLLYLLIYYNFSAKRRNANHPCPVCGKFYVNEGSLRKHLACHPEMANQLSSSLRMWPCTVCTAVFTHENGKNDYLNLF